MAQLLIRRLDDGVKTRLKARAKKHGRSLEAEARAILEEAAVREGAKGRSGKGLGSRIADRFRGIGFRKDERERFENAIGELWRDSSLRFIEFGK